MKPVVLFRTCFQNESEFEISKKYFEVFKTRSEVISNSLVIGRYSTLPYYNELYDDLKFNKSYLVNDKENYAWISSFDYYSDLKAFTPESWFDHNFYKAPEGQFVVKGKINSKKHKWNKLMYAESKEQASKIASLLLDDMTLSDQGIVYRRYHKLRTFEIGLSGLPFTNEWRMFFYKNKLLDAGYYWSDTAQNVPKHLPHKAVDLAQKVADIASKFTNFFVLDVAELDSNKPVNEGEWILIEVNDGQMSGLSDCDPDKLYKRLKETI